MMWRTLIGGGLVLGCLGCTTPSVVVVPNDRVLEKVYDQHGQLVPGRSSISDGWILELAQDLERCAHPPKTSALDVDPGFYINLPVGPYQGDQFYLEVGP